MTEDKDMTMTNADETSAPMWNQKIQGKRLTLTNSMQKLMKSSERKKN